MSTSSTIVPSAERVLDGIPASPGIAIARACVLAPEFEGELDDRKLDDNEVASELDRFNAAVQETDKLLAQIESIAREEVQERAEIFEAMRMMLSDPALAGAITGHIVNLRSTAHAAIVAELSHLAGYFLRSNDETMRSRAEDIRALQSHLLSFILNSPTQRCLGSDQVVVVPSLAPGDAVIYARTGVGAFVLESGGINSHAAILARAFGIPMVAGIRGVARLVRQEEMIIVDGYVGRIVISPSPETVEHYRERKEALELQRHRIREVKSLPAETKDGTRVTLGANLDMLDEIEGALENGADTVGLMRTEYLVMGRDSNVSMEEQLHYYRQAAERAYPLTVTLRAFDIGSEKLSGESWGATHSPLGLRGTRLLLARRDIFRRQLEAILRASSMKNLQLMLPMVTSAQEMRQVQALLNDVRASLRERNIPFDEQMPVGAMIETPASALIADVLAAECDFLSLGTNDLAQYTLAVDREDDAMVEHYDEFHPAVLKLIHLSVEAAHRGGIPITICGEMAANPLATSLLIGLGLRRFSVPPLELGPLKLRVRSIDGKEAALHAQAVLRMATAHDVRAYLEESFDVDARGAGIHIE